MKKIKRNWLNIISFFILLLGLLYGTFAFGYTYGQKGTAIIGLKSAPVNAINTDVGKPSSVDFSLFWDAWNKLKEKSVYTPDTQKMLYGSISGMLNSLADPYTVFFTPEDNKRFKEDISGEFVGIGIEIVMKNNYPTVVAPLSKTPAEAAGLKSGDVILEVDDTKSTDISFQEVVNRIRGEKGTTVKLKIARDGKDQPLEFSVVRDTIMVKSVEWETKTSGNKKYKYVSVRQFGDDTDGLFEQFAAEVTKDKPDGIIVDLRNNPGGYLSSAVNLSSYFLDGGTVVIERDKDGKDRDYEVSRKATLKGYKTVILVNSGSASASEIFSGALQDRKAGVLIGEKTFGKGSVQEIVELKDSSSVKITVAKWLTPNGRAINGVGIEPDIKLVRSEDLKNDNQLERGIEYLNTGK
jgi:carboxyl-terminal processing protease